MITQRPPRKFELGARVRLQRDRNKFGMIWGNAVWSDAGWKYEVLIDNDTRFYAEIDLVPYEEQRTIRLADREALLRDLVLLKLRQPLADNLYAAFASRTQFEVYQFKPALKFLSNPDQRLLIADEVGLGKTIEAGIIFLEMQARMDVARVLVMCPSVLTAKWRDEMRSRFDEQFTVLNTSSLRDFIGDYRRYGEAQRLKGIVALELVRRQEFYDAFQELEIPFDLVIIDEAHHLRNTTTQANQFASLVTQYADAMLLLTATPLQLGNRDLFNLLAILAPEEFENYEAFERRLEPNRYINAAERLLEQGHIADALNRLRLVRNTAEQARYENHPLYREIFERLEQPRPSHADLIAARRHLLELNTIAHIFTRTRKRQVQTANSPIRSAQTLYVDLIPTEWEFYNQVIRFARQQYRLTAGDWPSGFAVIMRERQAASCISAMRKHFEELVANRYQGAPEDEDSAQGVVDEGYQENLLEGQRNPARALLEAARGVGNTDTKFQVFLDALRENFTQDSKSKVLVFSFFRKTLEYLKQQLTLHGYNLRVIHGGIPIIDRQKQIEEFRDKPEVQILLSSEVGSEGLDFQFCNTLFNYDLPWNPMKVEQRIGRLDRFGQLSPRIKIFNLVIRNTIEERIFLRLYERIGIFQESIGDLEAILGDVIRELSQAVFTRELSPADEEWLARQYADRIERRRQEMETFEQQRLAFMGQDAIFASDVQNALDSGRFVSEAELRALVETYIHKKFPRARIEPNEDDSYVLVPDETLCNEIQTFVLRQRIGDLTSQNFLRVLRPNERVRFTYSTVLARERKLLEFITTRHPLARAAKHFWDSEQTDSVPMSYVVLEDETAVSGDYYYFLFLFEASGLQRDLTLVPIVISIESEQAHPELSQRFMRLAQNAPLLRVPAPTVDSIRFMRAEDSAKQFAAQEHDQRLHELQRSNDVLINARLGALQQTFEIKRHRIRSQLALAIDARIHTMRDSQLRRVEAKYQADRQTLQEQRQVTLNFKLALAGIAHINQQGGAPA